jgi:hypothetical protein
VWLKMPVVNTVVNILVCSGGMKLCYQLREFLLLRVISPSVVSYRIGSAVHDIKVKQSHCRP